MPLKIIFAGTATFAIPTLERLIASPHSIVAIYTQPDRPAGRGQKLTASPVKQFAEQHQLSIQQPKTLKDQPTQQILKNYQAEIMIDVAYGQLLPKPVLDSFQYGCLNIHPSLLPRWRGAAPIQRAILAGDTEIGVTIMQVDEGWDTGPILNQIKIPLQPTATTAELQNHLANLGAELLLSTLDQLIHHHLTPIPQDDAHSCYAAKITKSEAQLDWRLTANELDRMIRAFNDWPVAFTKINNQTLRIWRAQPLPTTTSNPPGTIIQANSQGIDVATSQGILRLLELQLPGGRILTAAAMLNSKQELFNIGNHFHG